MFRWNWHSRTWVLVVIFVVTMSPALIAQVICETSTTCPVGTTATVMTVTDTNVSDNGFQIKQTHVAAQTFEVPTDTCFKLNAVIFSARKNNSPGDLTVTAYDTVGTPAQPNNAVPNASATLPASCVDTSLGDELVTFSSPPSLIAGSTYAIVFSNGNGTGSNYYYLGVKAGAANQHNPGSPYVDGLYWQNDDTWSSQADNKDVRMTLCFSACSDGCTLTQGYWKNHPDDWPVETLTLGARSYTKSELLQILDESVVGNGLTSLAHQLIAVKLNIANGADGSAVSATVAAADTLIDSNVVPPIGSDSLAPSATSSLTAILTNYNEGVVGPGHCAE